MDETTTPAAAVRPSGLPRPSALPRSINKRPSHSALPRPNDALRQSTGIAQPPGLQKRSSIASFSRSTSSTVTAPREPLRQPKATAVAPTTIAPPVLRPSKASSGPRLAPRPSSRGNQQKRPPSPRKPGLGTEDEENHDQLGSLDSFRSASRQGFHDESPTEPPDLPPLEAPTKTRKSSRPSLSDRTIESLQNVPTTPKDRRRSSFFSPLESPMGPPPRPASSLSRHESDRSSRPGTSDGSFAAAIARGPNATKPTSYSAKPATRTSLGGFGFTPRTSSRLPSAWKPARDNNHHAEPPRSPSPSKRAATVARGSGVAPGKVTGSKTVSGRLSKPRPTLSDAFGSSQQSGQAKPESVTSQLPESSRESSAPSRQAAPQPSSTSSTALRQQIAAAKAAARKEKAKHDSPQDVVAGFGGSMDVASSADPFNQAPRDEQHILRNRIKTARLDGRLNIAALGLKEMPDAVMKMYDAAAMEESNVSWAEVVDLTRLNAADNEIDELGDGIFPDASADDFAADEDTEGNQFGGLEALDLHGNRLHALPMGLRRLERLTTLNLSHNKLENDCLGIISQITSLRDLRLGHNALSGSLAPSLCDLQQLERLDLQANRLLNLPESLRDLLSLRVLNVSQNQLTSLPMEALQSLKLIELKASSNALVGPLFSLGITSAHTTLQTLDVSNNSIAALTFAETLDLPRMRELDISNNHLTGLPSIAGWQELFTLMCSDNKITEIPAGFATLPKVRNANFAGNGIRLLDAEIGRMESLEGLVMASNPLRDKKFLTMNAQDIKRDLRARLEPTQTADEEVESLQTTDGDADATSQPLSTAVVGWTLKANGLLDLSGKGLTDSVNDSLGAFLQSNEVKNLDISGNKLTAVPPALWLAQDLRILDLSGNTLGSDYLYDELELPMLQELKLARCSITTLEPLLTQLQVPQLQTLDITANRLTGAVPALRDSYSALAMLFAGDNKFSSVSADALKGLQTVNLRSNNLAQLPAEIGLLWGEGLKNLEVGSNAFRVPNHRILEKGTEALMKWLRNRIPGYEESGD